MWVNRVLFDMIVSDNRDLQVKNSHLHATAASMAAGIEVANEQKVKDDLNIDWLRNRCNALEKERAILMNKVAGIHLPVPEIVMGIPRTMAPSFDSMPSFEDVGEQEAQRLGITHEDDGTLTYKNE